MTDRPDLPGFVRFAWMFFMQPVSLHYRVKASGIEDPGASARELWFRAGPDREIRRSYVRRLVVLLLAMPPIALGLSFCLELAGADINYAAVAVVVTLSLALGLALEARPGNPRFGVG